MGHCDATVNLLYLGNFASTDVDEGNYDAENTDFLLNTTIDHDTLQVVSTDVYSGRDDIVDDDDKGDGGGNIDEHEKIIADSFKANAHKNHFLRVLSEYYGKNQNGLKRPFQIIHPLISRWHGTC